MTVVLDASAVLALLFQETGAERVSQVADGAALSAVNLIEVLEKIAEKGGQTSRVLAALEEHRIRIIDFNIEQASHAADLKPITYKKNIALVWRLAEA